MLEFIDGFDHYTGADILSRSGMVQYTAGTNGAPTAQGQGRNFNAKGWAGDLFGVIGQRLASHFIGASSLITNNNDMVWAFFDTVGVDYQVDVVFRASNYSIEIWRGRQGIGTLIYRSANNVWTRGVGNFIEIWPKINTVTGSVKIHINHIEVVNATGLNTQETANAWWDRFEIYNQTLDDLYYCDTTAGAGSNPCNTLLGDPRAYTLFPTSNGSAAWTPLAGANWQEVNEIAFDGDATYNYSSTPGQDDLFNVGALPSTASGFLGVQTTVAGRKDDAGYRSVKQLYKSGGTTSVGSEQALPDTNYIYWSEMFAIDPDTGVDWIRTGINAAEPGYRMFA